MAHSGCINGTLNGADFSSPVPIIGLYIAAGSLLCLLLMLYDMAAGFRAREIWIPCKLFTLNSVTLTIFSVAAKLLVDLTTPMPSTTDQLSKLSGSALMCISMGFLFPSLGVSSKSECFMNMAALTILVITIIVNICIQISTGVIVLFVAQHIIVLCCISLLLMLLWVSAWEINHRKRIDSDRNKRIMTSNLGNMFQRLKKSYLCGYRCNPQLVSCSNAGHIIIAIICSVCAVTLTYAAFGSLVLKKFKFCSGSSDYDWSMSMIVYVQFLTVVVGCFAIILRCATFFKNMEVAVILNILESQAYAVSENPILGIVSTLDNWRKFLRVLFIAVAFLVILSELLIFIVSSCLGYTRSDEWISRKSEQDMERVMNEGKVELPNHLSRLLARTHHSYQLHYMELKDQAYPNHKGMKVSSFSIVLLVRIAQVSLPDNSYESLVQAFDQTMEIIQFIERTLNPKSLDSDNMLMLAKNVWAGPDFSSLFNENVDIGDESHSSLDRAIEIITSVETALPFDDVRRELGTIAEFINRKAYSSIGDLGSSIEQMFVDMCHMLLAQLPKALLQVLSDSQAEEYVKTVTVALKILSKVELIKDQIEWTFPAGCNNSRLFDDETEEVGYASWLC